MNYRILPVLTLNLRSCHSEMRWVVLGQALPYHFWRFWGQVPNVLPEKFMYFFAFLVHTKNVMNQILNTKLKKTVNQILYTGTKKEVNQILNTKFDFGQDDSPLYPYSTYTSEILPNKKNWFRFQFIFSIFII